MNILKIFLLSFGLLFAFGLMVLAQEETPSEITEAVNLDEDIQPEDLEVGEPRLLPDSPFYFLKNWARGIQATFTFNPVKKAELRLKFANEKLIEAKKIAQKTEDVELITKATENYQQEVDKIKNQVEKIKEKAKENPEVEKFLDKFVDQQILHEKLLQKLETQVPPEAFEKIKEVREAHLEKFQDVMLKLEDRKEKITEKLDKILEEQKGSQFKEFKNLEVLKGLEEKVPEEAKEAIQKAQENALKRLQGDLEKMSPEDQEKFNEYIGKIGGVKEKQLEILENLKAKIKEAVETPQGTQLKEKLEEGKTKIFEKIEEKLKKLDCPLWTPPAAGFCKEGRVVVTKDPETGCPLPPRCIIPGEIEIPSGIEIPDMLVCKDLWWFDNDHRYCQQERFCGLYIYLGLRTFETKKECETSLQITPEACITLWDPVCGENGKTYSNACFAKLAGVEVAYKGKCQEKECQTDADCPQLRCGPAGTISAKCIGVKAKCVDGKCQILSTPIESQIEEIP